jgi:hypothetical protein
MVFRRINRIKREEIIEFQPRNWRERVRRSWVRITLRRVKRRKVICDERIQMGGTRGRRIKEFISQNNWWGIGSESIIIWGSKEEKISGNIKTWAGHC